MRLSYREIVPSEDTTSKDVLVFFRKHIMCFISSDANNVTKHGSFDKRLIKSHLLYDMVIVLHDEVGAEETANPAAKHLNDSHSCHDEVHPVWTYEKLSLPFKESPSS